MLELNLLRVNGGTGFRLEVACLQNQLEATRANSFPLQAQAEAGLDELASLLGLAPGALDAELAGDTTVPLPPAQVTTGDPAEMLQRRPDIRAAERTLAAQTAQIGQAEAARFPKVTLMGLSGIGATSPSDLTHLDDYSAVIEPQLSWNFLDFGRNKSDDGRLCLATKSLGPGMGQ
jgi:outer membrane protein TolC